MPFPEILPALLIDRNTRPSVICADSVQASTALFTHSGIGTVRIWPPLPIKSAITQCSSRSGIGILEQFDQSLRGLGQIGAV